MRVWLKFTEGALAGETREVQLGDNRSAMVGRGPQCDVILGESDRTASSSHAKLWLDNETVYITDIGSQYGLYVNDKPTMKARLAQNDRVRFGFKGPVATISFKDAPEPLPLQPQRRVVRKQRPVAMTTVRMVPTDIASGSGAAPVPAPAAGHGGAAAPVQAEAGPPAAPPEPPPVLGAQPRAASISGGFQRITTSISGGFRPISGAAAGGGAPPGSLTESGGIPIPGPAEAPGLWKQCPFCAESIRAAAVKCRFCGEFLPVGSGAVPSPAAPGGVAAASAASAAGAVAAAAPPAAPAPAPSAPPAAAPAARGAMAGAGEPPSALAAALEVPGRPLEGGTDMLEGGGSETVMIGAEGGSAAASDDDEDEGTVMLEPGIHSKIEWDRETADDDDDDIERAIPGLTPPPLSDAERSAAAAGAGRDDDDDDDRDDDGDEDSLIERLAGEGKSPEEILAALEAHKAAGSKARGQAAAVEVVPEGAPPAKGGSRTVVGLPSFDDEERV